MKPLHKRILAKLSQEVWALPPDFLRLIHDICADRIEITADDAVKLRAMSEKFANGPIVPIDSESNPDRPSVLRVGDIGMQFINGPIVRYADFFTGMSGGTSLEAINADFAALEADPSVASIIQVYDSPGGQATGLLETAEMFRRGEKPSTAYVEGLAASAAYALASAADTIVLGPMAEVGSVGVAAMVSTGKSKDTAEFVSSQTPRKRPDATTDQGRNEIQARVDELGAAFIDAVAGLRGLEPAAVAAWEGGVATGARAISLGMADQQGILVDLVQPGPTGAVMAKREAVLSDAAPEKLDLPVAVTAEEIQARVDAAVSQERERARECVRIAAPALEADLGAELWAMLWNGEATGGDVAIAVLAKERANAQAIGTPPPPVSIVPSADSTVGAKSKPADPSDPQSQWDGNPKLREEFGTFEAYQAWHKANARGLIKTIGNA